MTAQPKTSAFGSITVFLSFYADVTYAFRVGRNCFYPAPNVDSAVIRFDLNPTPPGVDPVLFFQLTRRAFEQTGTVKLKGDWTNRDPEITSLLKELGRAGVPLYLYWAPGAERPKILPQVLTEAAIVSELQAKR